MSQYSMIAIFDEGCNSCLFRRLLHEEDDALVGHGDKRLQVLRRPNGDVVHFQYDVAQLQRVSNLSNRHLVEEMFATREKALALRLKSGC